MASSSNVDAVLSRNAKEVEKTTEVERLLGAFKLNPFEILDLPFGATDSDVKKQYRKKSLLIHPDKCNHPQAQDAFDLLNKAEGYLSDPTKRSEIDAIMNHCRIAVLKTVLGNGYSTGIPDDDPRLQNLKPSLDKQIKHKAKEVLVSDELARRQKTKVAYANEGAEKARMEEEVAKRKRKIAEKEKWEERREERIESWRDFSSKKGKKSKKNEHVLG